MSDKFLSIAGLIIAIIAILVSLLVPEIRKNIFGLDENEPSVKTARDILDEELQVAGSQIDMKDGGVTGNCLSTDLMNDSIFYLRVVIDDEIDNVYSGFISSELKRYTGGKEIELLRTKKDPDKGMLFEYSISVSDEETKTYVDIEEDLSNLKTVEIIGNLTCTELKERYIVAICDVSAKLAIHKSSRRLNKIIGKSLQSL